MAGGTWGAQNKTLPGVYINFTSTRGLPLTTSDRGVVAICEPLNWGPVAQVQTIEAGADVVPFTGYDITNSNNRFLQEIFKGSNRTAAPQKVLLYRPTANGSASATATTGKLTATARYPGTRGNDISIVITAVVDAPSSFTVNTVVDAQIVDTQVGANVADLTANDWVTFSGTGVLSATTGVPLAGGVNGAVQAAAYSTFLTAIEPYKFDTLIYDGTDSTVLSAMKAFIKRIADSNGQYAQLVASGMSNPDSRYIINVASGVTLSDGTVLTAAQTCWWVGGATSGARYNQSLTNAVYPDAVSVSPLQTSAQQSASITAGNFILSAENGVVRVVYDINSLVTLTNDITEPYRKNRVMRTLNQIANDIFVQFTANYIGVVNNNDAGRMQMKAAVVGLLTDIQANNGIQNFAAADVTVSAGTAIDAVVVTLAVQPVDSAEKIYMTISVS